jgi:hypothetical protein
VPGAAQPKPNVRKTLDTSLHVFIAREYLDNFIDKPTYMLGIPSAP